MNTCVALVGAYLRFNGYVTVPEQPILIGEGKPYRYHTATDVDILAVRFPNAAVVVPRMYGKVDDDLHLDIDPVLELERDTVDVIIGEVKSGRPRLNDGLREPDVLYATLRRVDPGFDVPLEETITKLIRHGEARCKSAGKKWRFRLAAFGEGNPGLDGGPFMVIQLRQVASFLMQTMREHHEVWKDAQFGDEVLDLLHIIDKMGFTWQLSQRDAEGNPPTTEPNVQPDELPQVQAARANGKVNARTNGRENTTQNTRKPRNVKPRKGAAEADPVAVAVAVIPNPAPRKRSRPQEMI